MKKVWFLIAATAIYFISCTSSKESFNLKFGKDYYNNPYVKKYKDNPNFIAPELAIAYIKEFKKHKYKVFGKAHLTNAWSYFNLQTLDSISSDPQTDSIFFFLAAFTKDKSIDKDMRGHPFVILEAVPKSEAVSFGKGGYEATAASAKPVFLTPKPICPPPNTGCRIPAAE